MHGFFKTEQMTNASVKLVYISHSASWEPHANRPSRWPAQLEATHPSYYFQRLPYYYKWEKRLQSILIRENLMFIRTKSLPLIALATEGAAFHQASLASGWDAKHSIATRAYYHCLRMAEHCCNVEAALAFNIHEVWVWTSYESFKFVFPLFQLCRWVKKVDVAREHLWCEEGGKRE